MIRKLTIMIASTAIAITMRIRTIIIVVTKILAQIPIIAIVTIILTIPITTIIMMTVFIEIMLVCPCSQEALVIYADGLHLPPPHNQLRVYLEGQGNILIIME